MKTINGETSCWLICIHFVGHVVKDDQLSVFYLPTLDG